MDNDRVGQLHRTIRIGNMGRGASFSNVGKMNSDELEEYDGKRLMEAVRVGDFHAVQDLIALGVPVNTALAIAGKYKRADIIGLLQQYKSTQGH